jgi:hypothetical protein
VLVELAAATPLLPGADVLAFLDVDSTQRQVYGYRKQGAAVGRLKGTKTLHPLLATLHPDRRAGHRRDPATQRQVRRRTRRLLMVSVGVATPRGSQDPSGRGLIAEHRRSYPDRENWTPSDLPAVGQACRPTNRSGTDGDVFQSAAHHLE